jgi:hypothetical protein
MSSDPRMLWVCLTLAWMGLFLIVSAYALGLRRKSRQRIAELQSELAEYDRLWELLKAAPSRVRRVSRPEFLVLTGGKR